VLLSAAKNILPPIHTHNRDKLYIFEKLNWLTAPERYERTSLTYFYKHIFYETSVSKTLKQFYVKIPEDSQSARKQIKYTLPLMRTGFGKASSFYQTIKMWNLLPTSVIHPTGTITFDEKLRKSLVKCRENEFIYDDTRILNTYVLRGIE